MELADDLKSLLAEFSTISLASQELVDENIKLRKNVEESEKQLLESRAVISRLEKDLQRKQNMLEMIHQQLSAIPELKMKVEDLTSSVIMLEKMSMTKDQEITRLQQKHLGDLNSLKDEIQKERENSREEETKRMEEMESFLKQAHETELVSMDKKYEREKQLLVDQLRTMEDEFKKVKAQHEEDLEMMKVQLVSAKGKASQAVPSNSEIYRKKMIAMQEHYEKQIQELLSKNQFNEGVAYASTTEPIKKKKKVSFALPSDNNNECDEDLETVAAISKANVKNKKCESIFAAAANRFSRAPTNTFNSPGVKSSSDIVASKIGNEDLRKNENVNRFPTSYKTQQNRFRFKFNNISSDTYGSNTEFGKFSSISSGGGADIVDENHDDADRTEVDERHDHNEEQSLKGGTKRKLFSEVAGPQMLD